ncbi:MAG TPA: AmmeMemoRadiSam system protein A [Deltaproteobacteria bacterium]|nr:AmmeMemoRadiSam system protein A [Deltaproteobacteria bacterium]
MALSEKGKAGLLRIARSAIETYLREGRVEVPAAADDELCARGGAFVTLHRGGRLRGCIGLMVSQKPLFETVAEMAVSAAFRDPRFPPVTADELDELDIEISVLTPLRRISGPDEIEVGRHGLYIVKGPHTGVLLPQVAVEHGFDRERFLRETAVKAGLDPEEWKEAEIHTFEAEVFGEKDTRSCAR